MAYTKPSWSRTSVVLLVKLGVQTNPDLYPAQAPDLGVPQAPHHVWHAPQGMAHAWRRLGLQGKVDLSKSGPK